MDDLLEALFSAAAEAEKKRHELLFWRFGRAAYEELVYATAPPLPNEVVKELGGTYYQDALLYRQQRIDAGLAAWGKNDGTLLGVPVRCIETLNGWELVSRPLLRDELALRLQEDGAEEVAT